MRITVVSMHYPPERSGSAPYVAIPAEAWAAGGHEVTVISGLPHYPEWTAKAYPAVPRVERRNGVTVLRRWHYVPRQPSSIRRAVYEASMFVAASSRITRMLKSDVTIGVTPALTGAAVAAAAAAVNSNPLGLIIHDLMGKGAGQTGVGGSFVAGSVQALEERLVAAADVCLVLNGAFASALNRVRPEGEFVVALPCASRDPSSGSRADARVTMGWADDQIVCLHAGNIGQKQGLDNVVRAAARMRDDRRFRFVILGDGNDRVRVQGLVETLRLDNVAFIPPTNDDDYDAALIAADVLLLNQRPEVEDMSYPSKLSAYLRAGRPVIGAVAPGSTAAAVLQASGGGLLVPPGDAEGMAAAIVGLHDEPEVSAALGAAGRAFAQSELSIDAMLARYDEMLERLTSTR